jgi:hypothetical protein
VPSPVRCVDRGLLHPARSGSTSCRSGRIRACGRFLRGVIAFPRRACALGLACLALVAAAPAGVAQPLFAADDTLSVTLQGPWAELRGRNAERRRHPGALMHVDANGREHRIAVTVEPRGITRRRLCRFPPLWLRLQPGDAADSVLEGQHALKLVTHCDPRPSWEQHYVLELLAYRIHNRITSHSFLVRPLAITYLDAQGGVPDGPRFGFALEPAEQMARRNGRVRLRGGAFRARDYDPLALSRFMLFQYLVGNTDWEVQGVVGEPECCHNVRVTAANRTATTGLVAVPYDLDSSGFVNAPYAGPDARLPIRAVTERLFRGFCIHNPALADARREVLGQREAILALVRDEPRLAPRRRQAALRYLEAGLETLADEAAFRREVIARCRS